MSTPSTTSTTMRVATMSKEKAAAAQKRAVQAALAIDKLDHRYSDDKKERERLNQVIEDALLAQAKENNDEQS